MEAKSTEQAHPNREWHFTCNPLHHDSFTDVMLQIILQQISFLISKALVQAVLYHKRIRSSNLSTFSSEGADFAQNRKGRREQSKMHFLFLKEIPDPYMSPPPTLLCVSQLLARKISTSLSITANISALIWEVLSHSSSLCFTKANC